MSTQDPGGTPSPDVLIVGAGPVGLAAACELARQGVVPRVVAQGSGPVKESRALGVQARTLELLERLGVSETMVREGLPMVGFRLHDRTTSLARLDLSRLDSPYPFLISLPQSETEKALLARLRQLGRDVEWDTTLTELTNGPDRVRARLRRPDGSAEEVEVPWLVGCDGAHSTVRKALGLPFAGERLPEWFVLADLHIDWELSHQEGHAFLSPEGPLAVFPMPGEAFYRIVAALRGQPVDQRPEPVLADLEELIARRTGLAARLSHPVWISSFLIQRRMVPSYRQGRVFLAGDAAHIHSPVGGQGMNTGIQDALNLGWKLALVQRGLAGPALLDSYQAERHPVGSRLLRGTQRATEMITLRQRWAQLTRNLLLRALVSRGAVQRRVIRALSMIDIGYRKSPIVAEHCPSLARCLFPDGSTTRASVREWRAFRKGPRPGERAPDAVISAEPGGAPRSLFEVLRDPRHVLLVFAGTRPRDEAGACLAAAEEVARRHAQVLSVQVLAQRPAGLTAPAPVALLGDARGLAHRRYGAAAPCWYLIRPDGYVAWRGLAAGPAHLDAYLDRVLGGMQ